MKTIKGKHTPETQDIDSTKNDLKSSKNNSQTKEHKLWSDIKKWWEKEGAPDRIMVILTLAIVLLTIPNIYFSCSQIKQSEKFSIIEARAYIRYDGAKEVHLLDIGKQGTIISNITNVGKTPAYNEFSVSRIKFGEVKEEDIQIAEHPTNKGVSIGAGQTISIQTSTDTALTIKDTLKLRNSILDKKLTPFVYGIIYYQDAFGCYHWTRYCMGYRYDTDKFFYNDKFNDCDKEE
jgi:hypothetical protein